MIDLFVQNCIQYQIGCSIYVYIYIFFFYKLLIDKIFCGEKYPMSVE